MFLGADVTKFSREGPRTQQMVQVERHHNTLISCYSALFQKADNLCYFVFLVISFIVFLFYISSLSASSKTYDKRLGFERQLNTSIPSMTIIEYENPDDILGLIPDPDDKFSPLKASNEKSFSEADSVVDFVTSKEEIILDREPSQYIKDLHLSDKKLRELNLTIQNLDFIHIAKNAGTAMEHIGQQIGRGWGIKKLWKTRGRVITDEGISCRFPWHVPPRLFRYDAYPLNWNFCVVRHPFSRLISEFKFHQLHRGNPLNRNVYFDIAYSLDAEGINKWIDDAFTRYKTIRHPKADPKKINNGKWIHDCHLIPMTEFIMDFDGTRTCQFVLKLENIDHDFEELMKVFGFKANLTVANQSRHTKKYARFNNASISVDLISQENMEMLRELYKDDLKYYENPEGFKFFDFGDMH